MKQTLAFDVYGTLIDTAGAYHTLEKYVGNQARTFMELWRTKQLEYSFRRAAMHRYVDFSICTKQALDYCSLFLKIPLTEEQHLALLEAYTDLPSFEDAGPCLNTLKDHGYAMYAFSNGSTDAVTRLLKKAQILLLFDGVVSVSKTQMFKPNPKVYAHFNATTESEKAASWLISGNSFDVMGAAAYGMQTVFVQRNSNTVYDPWDIPPNITINSLSDLPEALNSYSKNKGI